MALTTNCLIHFYYRAPVKSARLNEMNLDLNISVLFLFLKVELFSVKNTLRMLPNGISQIRIHYD